MYLHEGACTRSKNRAKVKNNHIREQKWVDPIFHQDNAKKVTISSCHTLEKIKNSCYLAEDFVTLSYVLLSMLSPQRCSSLFPDMNVVIDLR